MRSSTQITSSLYPSVAVALPSVDAKSYPNSVFPCQIVSHSFANGDRRAGVRRLECRVFRKCIVTGQSQEEQERVAWPNIERYRDLRFRARRVITSRGRSCHITLRLRAHLLATASASLLSSTIITSCPLASNAYTTANYFHCATRFSRDIHTHCVSPCRCRLRPIIYRIDTVCHLRPAHMPPSVA